MTYRPIIIETSSQSIPYHNAEQDGGTRTCTDSGRFIIDYICFCKINTNFYLHHFSILFVPEKTEYY